MIKKTVKSILQIFAALIIIFGCGAVITDVLAQRYSAIAYNPRWINFMLMLMGGMALYFAAALLVSRRTLMYMLPLVIILVSVLSLYGWQDANIPAYKIKPRHYSSELLLCLNNNLHHLQKQSECYTQATSGSDNSFIADYCARKSYLGQVDNNAARKYREAECRYEFSHKGGADE